MSKTTKAWMFKHEIAKTSAIFGRTHGISVVFEGDQAGTDGKTIYLPVMSDTADLTNLQMRVIRGFVDHEAGHLRRSDMPLIMDKYPRWMKNGKEGLKTLHNSIEDIWMEPLVQQDYVGSTKNLAAVAEMVNEKEADGMVSSGYDMKAVNASTVGMGIRIAGRRKYAHNEHAQKMWDALSKEVQDWAEKIVEEASKSKSSADNIRIAKAVWKKLEQDPELKSDPEEFNEKEQQALADQVEDGDGDGAGDGIEVTEAQKNPYDKLEPFFSDMSGKIVDVDGKSLTSTGEMSDVLKEGIPAMARPTGTLVGTYRILSTKNDAVINAKSPDNLKKYFHEFNGKDHYSYERIGNYDEQKASISSHTAVIKTKLRRGILAQQRRDWERGREHGRLDTRRLVAAVCGSTSVYKTRTDREDLDTAVMVLVDQSGSMSGEKIRVARQCAISLAEALEGTSISYSITGFTCFNVDSTYARSGRYHRYESNFILQYKDFDQKLHTAKEPISRMLAHANNADYDAIVWAISELKSRPESRKILFVLSDGEPVHTTDADQTELIRHAKKAVEDGEKMGVEIVGLGIRSDAVKRIYKDHIVVSSLQDFAETYLNKFIKILVKKGEKR